MSVSYLCIYIRRQKAWLICHIKNCQNLFLSLTYLHLKSLLIFLLFNKSYFQEKVVVSAFESVIALGEEQNHDQTPGIYFVLKCILNFF